MTTEVTSTSATGRVERRTTHSDPSTPLPPEGVTVRIAGMSFRYVGATHASLPDFDTSFIGHHDGAELRGCSDEGENYLILDHRDTDTAGACRVEFWEPLAPSEAHVVGLLALADCRPEERAALEVFSVAELVEQIQKD